MTVFRAKNRHGRRNDLRQSIYTMLLQPGRSPSISEIKKRLIGDASEAGPHRVSASYRQIELHSRNLGVTCSSRGARSKEQEQQDAELVDEPAELPATGAVPSR